MIKPNINLAEYSEEYINQIESSLLAGEYLDGYHLESLRAYYQARAKICAKFDEVRLLSRMIRLINLRLIKNKAISLLGY